MKQDEMKLLESRWPYMLPRAPVASPPLGHMAKAYMTLGEAAACPAPRKTKSVRLKEEDVSEMFFFLLGSFFSFFFFSSSLLPYFYFIFWLHFLSCVVSIRSCVVCVSCHVSASCNHLILVHFPYYLFFFSLKVRKSMDKQEREKLLKAEKARQQLNKSREVSRDLSHYVYDSTDRLRAETELKLRHHKVKNFGGTPCKSLSPINTHIIFLILTLLFIFTYSLFHSL